MCSVRGMGVAVIVSTSTVARKAFEPLFHFDAEALLFVDDQQAQVVKVHVGLGQPVRADDDVDRAIDQAGNGFALLAIGGEAAEHVDAERKFGHPLR